MILPEEKQQLLEKVKSFSNYIYGLENDAEKVRAIADSGLSVVLTLDNDNITGWVEGFTEEECNANDGEIADLCYLNPFDGYGREMFIEALGIKWEHC